MTLESYIEAILFWRGESVSVKRLAELLNKSEEEIKNAISKLEENLKGRGVVLVHKDDEVMLGTVKEADEIISRLTKEELIRDLGKAGLETLSIILYKGPITRREIDYIRGVNSSFILRNLLIRGLVEKCDSSDNNRSFSYKPTFDLLTHLGISKTADLPEYETARKELAEMEQSDVASKEALKESGKKQDESIENTKNNASR